MSAFCIPTPCIVPLKLPVFGKSKSIDTSTNIEMLCDTELPGIEVFYTIDCTKPQPYVGIVQGSKTLKYIKPFALPPGKVTVKAVAIHAIHHSICSNVITKTFCVKDLHKKRTKTKSVSKNLLMNDGEEETVCEDADDAILPNIESFETDADRENGGGGEDKDFVDCDDHSVIEDFPEVSYGSPERKPCEPVDGAAAIDESEGEDVPESQTPYDATFIVQENFDDPEKVKPSSLFQVEEVASDLEQHTSNHTEIPVQYCSSCNKGNSLVARYCDACGAKLHKTCTICKEPNPIVANYCQFCGNKFTLELLNEESRFEQPPPIQKKSKGILAKPVTVTRGCLCARPTCAHKLSQTDCITEKIRKILGKPSRTLPDKLSKGIQTPERFDGVRRKSPTSTPGKGYWRVQTDYVCNHLKAYANNNAEFRKSIGSPSLGRFISADVEQQDESLLVHLQFEILPDKKRKELKDQF